MNLLRLRFATLFAAFLGLSLTQPLLAQTLADAIDQPTLSITSSGNLPWTAQTATTHAGVDAARSGAITHNQTSEISTTVTGPGNLSFWWKVSSESDCDYLRFSIDGVEQSEIISGMVDWTQKSYGLSAGSHALKWSYTKDNSVSLGSDCGWLDQVAFEPATPSPEIAVEQPAGTNLVDGGAYVAFGRTGVGSTVVKTFTIRNLGTSTLTGLVLSRDGSNASDFTLGSLTTTSLAPGANTNFTVSFTPASLGSRSVAIHIASNDTDESPFNIYLTETGIPLPYTYTTNNSQEATITGYTGDGGFVNIPSRIVGLSVKNIGFRAFSENTAITSVSIPASVTLIDNFAFESCIGLASVNISDSVGYIAMSAFDGCTSMTEIAVDPENLIYSSREGILLNKSMTQLKLCPEGKIGSVNIPKSVTSIGDGAFGGCAGLTSITIPNNVTSIGNLAFYKCSGLTGIIIPNNITRIGIWMFAHCTSLKSFYISNNVTSIESGAFYKCTGLEEIVIPPSVTVIGDSAFSGCSGLTEITVPTGVTSIESETFMDCTGLKSVTIPNSVTSIGNSAFSQCSNLPSIVIPDSVTSIGSSVFSGCGGLTGVTIPNRITSIGDYTFRVCTGLRSVTIPTSVTSIGFGAFFGCSRLASVTIPNSVSSVGEHAFAYCSAMTKVTISNGVISIGRWAFNNCTELADITIPSSVTSIGYMAFGYCSSMTEVTISEGVTAIGEYVFIECIELNSLIFSNSLKSIGGGAFLGCIGLTSLTLPNSLTIIGDDAFGMCSGLTSLRIPNGVTSIGERAFRECSGLKTITISKSLTSIADDAFGECSSLTQAIFLGDAPELGWRVFDGTPSEFSIYYNTGAIGFPTQSVTWKNYKSIAMVAIPRTLVEQPAGNDVPNGNSESFGSVALGSSMSLTFTIRNIGGANLTGITITKNGANEADFILEALGAASLEPDEFTTFRVTFRPTSMGARSAVIHISSNDPFENPFDIRLSGDGVPPLVEVAFGGAALSPVFDPATVTYTGSVTYGTASVDVTPIAADTALIIKVNGVDVASGTPITVPVSAKTIHIEVTSSDGSIIANYIIGLQIGRNRVIYVNSSAAMGGDGTSWTKAYRSLQDALYKAVEGNEVWVASGTYYPDRGISVTAGDRSASFTLKQGVGLVGGFAGTETDIAQRDLATNETLLSGKIEESSTSGSNHVVTVLGNAYLNGITVTKGQGGWVDVDANPYVGQGAGVYVPSTSEIVMMNCKLKDNVIKSLYGGPEGGAIYSMSSVTLINCELIGNSAQVGGAVFARSVNASNCIFSSNSASDGGAISADSVITTGCTFSANSAYSNGGAIDCTAPGSRYVDKFASVKARNCKFVGNTAGRGGAIYSYAARAASMFGNAVVEVQITDSTFSDNVANEGGAIYAYSSHRCRVEAINSAFYRNTAQVGMGGAISASLNGFASSGIPYVSTYTTNCVFSQNKAMNGGAIYTSGLQTFGSFSNDTIVKNCTLVDNNVTGASGDGGDIYSDGFVALQNSILWNVIEESQISKVYLSKGGSIDDLSSNLIQGGRDAISAEESGIVSPTSPLTVDPRFLNPSSPDGTDGIWRSADDGYRLANDSPAVNKGSNTMISDYLDLDNDEDVDEPLPVDISGHARKQGSSLDLGAYETGGQSYAIHIEEQPKSIIRTTGDTATISVNATGCDLMYQWYLGNSGNTSRPIPGAVADSFTIQSVTSSANYWVRISNVQGAEDSNAALVTCMPSSNSTLSALAISCGTLSPSFSAATTTYSANSSCSSLTLQAIASSGESLISVNGNVAVSGSTSKVIDLVNIAASTISIVVVAPDGISKSTYRIVIEGATSTPFSTWLLAKGLPANTNLLSDPNGDGVSLLMAYAFNLNPAHNLSGSMPRPVVTADRMDLTFYAGNADVAYLVETSTDLSFWSTAGVTLSTADANGMRTATFLKAGPTRFMRLRPVIKGSAYSPWRVAAFSTADLGNAEVSDDLADPDHDGIPNILEYAMAGQPKGSDANCAPTAGHAGGYLTLTYRQSKSATDIAFMPQASSGIGGSWSSAGLVETGRVDHGTYWLVTVRDAIPIAAAPHRFMRLVVER